MVLQLFASRTAIHILVAEIDKVLFAEATLCLHTSCHWLGKRHRNPRHVAGKDFLAAVIAPISNGVEFVGAEDILCPGGDVGELCPVRAVLVTSCAMIR